MATYNDIGISQDLDWNRIRKLIRIGLFAGVMVLIGDMLLGWGVRDPQLTGLEGKLSAYLVLSDGRIFWSSFLGLIGIPLECLCYFAIYRMIAPYSAQYAHRYRSGIFGCLIFGGCGVHVPCLACVFFYKTMMNTSPDTALNATVRFGEYFLLPGMILFFVFFAVLSISQIAAFARGYTPYPRWCWVFSVPVGMAAAYSLKLFGNHALTNALTAGWISVGNLWMFGGLLICAKKCAKGEDGQGNRKCLR